MPTFFDDLYASTFHEAGIGEETLYISPLDIRCVAFVVVLGVALRVAMRVDAKRASPTPTT